MKTLHLLVLVTLACDRAYAFTLRVTACNDSAAGTPDEEIAFQFCEGGSYCIEDDTENEEEELPSGVTISDGSTISIAVSPGYEPTTVKFIKGYEDYAYDAWCINEVTWENGDNLLGEDAKWYLERQTDTYGCIDGLADVDDSEVSACASEWVFFNINGASDYEYDVRVKACAGTSSSSATAYFCSNSLCDGTIGEEQSVLLEMNDVEGGWTDVSFPLPFNPLGMRLEEAEGDVEWCAEELTFNAFLVILATTDVTDFETTGSQIFHNIQSSGQGDPPTPSPVDGSTAAPVDETIADEESDDDRWLDAAWEVAVTVIGAAIVAAGAGCLALTCRRARTLSGPPRRPDAHSWQAKEQEERPYFS